MTRSQRKCLAVGIGAILAAAALICIIWAGTYLPGFTGEVFSTIAGFLWTPVILELSIFVTGLVLVLWINFFVRSREGDEFVFLEQVDDPAPSLPGTARSAVFADRPEPRGLAPHLATIEGALELGDHQQAAELLLELPSEYLDTREGLDLRLRLARAQGRSDAAESLAQRLADFDREE